MTQVIGSINKNDNNFILTGTKHKNGKIFGKGVIKDLANNKVIELTLNDNKIFKLDLDIKKGKDISELLLSVNSKHNIVDEGRECSAIFFMDKHKLFFKKEEWKCNYCNKDFKNCN